MEDMICRHMIAVSVHGTEAIICRQRYRCCTL